MARRLFVAVLVAFTVSVIAFSLMRISGDLAVMLAGEDATAEQVEIIRERFGLNRPYYIQYLEWMGKAVQFDFGESMFYPQSVSSLIVDRITNTLTLAGFGLAFALSLSIPMGVLAALRPDSWIDRLALTIAVLGQALPGFWFALILMFIFGLYLGMFPISGSDTYWHFVLPAISLGYYSTPAVMRLTRTGMLEVMSSDYIRTARAKGLHTGTILFKHALRNAVIPVVALSAVQFGNMLGGSIVTETVFQIQGLGKLAYDGVLKNDFPVVQAVLLLVAVFYIVLVLLGDLLNAWLDPRIRVG
ncbi:MAG: ABC transporter permease [Acetobacterales bacterium]